MNHTCNTTVAWITEHTNADEDDYNEKKREIEFVCRPIIMRFFANTGIFRAPERSFNTGGGPSIDEIE